MAHYRHYRVFKQKCQTKTIINTQCNDFYDANFISVDEFRQVEIGYKSVF